MPSQRQLRVAEQVRQLLAEDLQKGVVHDHRLDGVSVTIGEVRMSPDLKHATVFANELGGTLSDATAQGLERASAFLGGRLARRMNLKYAPRLHFVADASFDEADRMERLIARSLRDLPRGEPEDKVQEAPRSGGGNGEPDGA